MKPMTDYLTYMRLSIAEAFARSKDVQCHDCRHAARGRCLVWGRPTVSLVTCQHAESDSVTIRDLMAKNH